MRRVLVAVTRRQDDQRTIRSGDHGVEKVGDDEGREGDADVEQAFFEQRDRIVRLSFAQPAPPVAVVTSVGSDGEDRLEQLLGSVS